MGSQDQRRTFLCNMSLIQSADNDNELHEVTHASEASEPLSGRIKRPNKPLYQPPQATSSRRRSSPPNATSSTTSASEAESQEEGTWDSLYNDAGECIDPDLISEFKSALSLSDEEDLKFERAAGDYSGFTVSDTQFDLTDNEYAHVLEVYGFADNLKTTDIFARIAGAGYVPLATVHLPIDPDRLVPAPPISTSCGWMTLTHWQFLDLRSRQTRHCTSRSRI